MRHFAFLLCVSISMVQGNVPYQPYYDDSLYQYQSDAELQSPNLIHDSRLFWSLFTTTTTTTTTTTCTVFTNAPCNVGRRRRFLEAEDESIDPSPVNKVETTRLAEMGPSSRNERRADPQMAFWRGYPDYVMPQSTFGYRYFPADYYNPFVRQPVIVANPRFFLRVTSTSTSTTTTTSRSTPICSQASGFNAC
ncbi:hypothetical protein GHT06_008425 [Daphnia sinensis]|uniref:Uncharacterized protein n=1 Tax=Daphnia sinensis TaxID=1820382 RepID=A0AAD5L3Q2_9CRUS|nr:hypothetical protein GHT06_008425 [Daphnia sinensis]